VECRFWLLCCTQVAACREILPGRQDLQMLLPGRQDLQRSDELQFQVWWHKMTDSHSVHSGQKENP
jgi:hypothetical protein